MAAAFGYRRSWRDIRFVSNIDGHALESGIAGLNPHDTLVVVVSKSFTTAETLENTRRAVEWLSAAGASTPYDPIVAITRSAASRVGKECVSTCTSLWWTLI